MRVEQCTECGASAQECADQRTASNDHVACCFECRYRGPLHIDLTTNGRIDTLTRNMSGALARIGKLERELEQLRGLPDDS